MLTTSDIQVLCQTFERRNEAILTVEHVPNRSNELWSVTVRFQAAAGQWWYFKRNYGGFDFDEQDFLGLAYEVFGLAIQASQQE